MNYSKQCKNCKQRLHFWKGSRKWPFTPIRGCDWCSKAARNRFLGESVLSIILQTFSFFFFLEEYILLPVSLLFQISHVENPGCHTTSCDDDTTRMPRSTPAHPSRVILKPHQWIHVSAIINLTADIHQHCAKEAARTIYKDIQELYSCVFFNIL